MKTYSLAALTVLAASVMMAGCGTDPHIHGDERELLHEQTQATLQDFKTVDPTLSGLMDKANAFAIFPKVYSGGAGLGGAHGNGEVFQSGHLIGYADMSQGSIGLQLGGQKYAEIVLFENASSLVDFQNGVLEFDARANAVAASKGAAATANYRRGVIVFTLPEGGLMAQASVGVQKFRFQPAN